VRINRPAVFRLTYSHEIFGCSNANTLPRRSEHYTFHLRSADGFWDSSPAGSFVALLASFVAQVRALGKDLGGSS
jgi:hypothetical protein